MTALLSFIVDLVISPFTRKEGRLELLKPKKEMEGLLEEQSFARTYSVVKEQSG
jgi:hypothetical protein